MLFKKIILFSLLIIVAEQWVYHALIKNSLPDFWGNEELTGKLRYLRLHPEINTVFLGSSKVKAQIIPRIFDSTVKGKTKSFNMGCMGLIIPETFNVLNYLIDSSTVKTIFFEMRPAYHITGKNLHITRTTYYHTASDYASTLKIACNSHLPVVKKFNIYTTFTIAAAEKLINFNLSEGLINYKNYDSLKTNYDSDGGVVIMGTEPNALLKASHAELDGRAALSVTYMDQYRVDSLKQFSYNISYYNKMVKILDRAKEKKINIVLVFPTALRDFEYIEVLPLLRQLSKTPQVIFASASSYPELYKPENNFETDHLNVKGADLYSVYLANAYQKIFGE